MNHDTWLDQAEIYALGALDGVELASFRQHLADGCSLCEARIAGTAETLAYALPRVAPPAELKARVLGAVGLAPVRLSRRALEAGVILLVALGLAVWAAGASKREAAGPVHTPEMQKLLSTAGLKYTKLEPRGIPTTAVGNLHWHPSICGGCFTFENLDKIKAGETYQLWAMSANGPPVSLGVFAADKNGQAHVDVPSLPDKSAYETFAVTVEKIGGAPQPTGFIQLMGKL